MARFWTIYRFHVRQYFRNSYFVMLVFISTLSLLMLKYLTAYSQGRSLSAQDVVIAGAFGMWSSAVTSSGILHFQRAQGVLVYLVNSPTPSLSNLTALVSAPASFGLLAYPMAYLAGGILNGFHFVDFQFAYLGEILLFWISAVAITYLIAELFLLTPNAFVYENLFVMPVMIFSGLFTINGANTELMRAIGRVIPITYPVQLLTAVSRFSWADFALWLIVLVVWLLIGYVIFKSLIYKIRVKGIVEVV